MLTLKLAITMVNIKGKLYLLVLLFTLCSTIGSAQVYRLRAFQGYYCERSNYGSPIEWQSINILAVVDFNKNKLQIYSQEYQDYDFIEVSHKWEYPESTVYDVAVVNQQGEKGDLNLTIFRDRSEYHIATIQLMLPNRIIMYRLGFDD